MQTSAQLAQMDDGSCRSAIPSHHLLPHPKFFHLPLWILMHAVSRYFAIPLQKLQLFSLTAPTLLVQLPRNS